MKDTQLYGFDLARIAEVYLSTLSAKMKVHGMGRHFKPFLFISENDGQLHQVELADSLGRDKVSIMRAIDYLEARQLIERKKDKEDGRCQKLFVTSKGKDLLPVLNNAIEETNEIMFSHLPENEFSRLSKNICQLVQHLEDLPESDYIINPEKRIK